jgi:hypothetical protein
VSAGSGNLCAQTKYAEVENKLGYTTSFQPGPKEISFKSSSKISERLCWYLSSDLISYFAHIQYILGKFESYYRIVILSRTLKITVVREH